MKILISAYACEPDKGSEPEVGWNWIRQISRYHEVWVVTRANNREAIEKKLSQYPINNVNFCYVDLPYWMRFWKRGARGLHFYYYIWQMYIYFIVRKLHKIIHFDLIHHITFVTLRFPSFLSFLPVPLIWGPLGGGGHIPLAFYKELSPLGRSLERLRRLLCFITQIDPFNRFTHRQARIIVVVNRDTYQAISPRYHVKTRIFPAIGLSVEAIGAYDIEKKTKREEGFVIASIGALIPLKGFGLVIKALSKLPKERAIEFWIIGEGMELRWLRCIAKIYGVENRVRFKGQLSRREVFQMIRNIDIFVFPSLRDSGGFVVLEAMAFQKPVICLDIGGPGEIVTDQCGIKIKPTTPEQVIKDFAEAIERLAKDPELRYKMGQIGRKRVKEVFDWDKKGLEITKIYDQVFKSLKAL